MNLCVAIYTMQSFNQINFNDLSVDELINYIVNKHHGFAKNMLILTLQHSKQLAEEGDSNALQISLILEKLKIRFEQHFATEEEILYPYVKKLLEWKKNSNNKMIPGVDLISNPIHLITKEHDELLKILMEIRVITGNYNSITAQKPNQKLLHAELFEMEQDIQKHIYIENNILFAKLLKYKTRYFC